MRKNRGRGFKGQLKLDITRLQRQKAKLERRIQKMVQEDILIGNLIAAMEIARKAEAPTPAAEAAQVAEGTAKANAELDAKIAEVTPAKEDPNVQTQG